MQPPTCDQCQSRGLYGVIMEPFPTTEPWRDRWRCPDCGETTTTSDPGELYAMQDESRAAALLAGTSEECTWYIPERKPGSNGGGDATGKAKPKVNPYRWMRRGV